MSDFVAKRPTLDANWRAVVLFGRNVASYKFALAKTLLSMAERNEDLVTLDELATPFARHLCAHLSQVDKQTTSRSSRFLEACRAFNRGELAEQRLIETTTQLGFTNVLDAFHVVSSAPVPTRFFLDERSAGRGRGGIRLTDDLRRLSTSFQGGSLPQEVEARWRLVETAWALDLQAGNVAVLADSEAELLYVGRVRRINLTGVKPALNGYQRGCCFYCRAEVDLASSDVDHFFPWVLRERGDMPDADGVWNLVLACRPCNRGNGGKGARVPAPHLLGRLHERNNWLVDSHHPLRETIMLQTGKDTHSRQSFLRARQRIALDALVSEWQPKDHASDHAC